MASTTTLRFTRTTELNTQGRLGPPLRLITRVTQTGKEGVIRYAAVEFHKEGQDCEGHERTIRNVSTGPGLNEITFDYQYAVVSGVDNVPEAWPQEIKDALLELAGYCLPNGTVTLQLPVDTAKSPDAVAKFVEILNHNNVKRLWNCYNIGGVQEPKVSWDEMMAHYEEDKLEEKSPVGAQQHFASPEEARIKLAYSRFMEHQWECKVAKHLARGDFEAAFIRVADNAILACVKRNFQGRALAKAAFDEHMTIVLTLKRDEDEEDDVEHDEDHKNKDIEASGQLTSNHLFVDCDLVISLKKVGKTLKSKMTRLGERENFLRIDLEIEVIDKLAKDNVQAINDCYDRLEPIYKRFWPALLVEGAEPLKVENFVTDIMGMEQAAFDRIVQAVIDKMTQQGTPPNAEQEILLRASCLNYGGLRVIWGPPGTGKTFLATKLAEIFLRCPDTGVAVFAPSNGSTDRIFDALQGWLKGRVPGPPYEALRAHRQMVELDHFWKTIDPFGLGNKARQKRDARVPSTPIGRYYTRQKEAAQKKLIQNPDKGVTAAILTAARTGQLFGQNKRSIEQEFDLQRAKEQLPVLKRFLDCAQIRYGKPLRVHERDDAFNAWSFIRKQVVGSRKLLVSTLGNATSKLLSDSVMRDSKYIVLILDEQALDTDASLINTLVGFINKERIENEFGNTTPIVNVILIGDHRQNSPLIKSNEAGANVFGPQLANSPFVRLFKSGFKIDVLLEQHRMAPVLCRLPNLRCYDGRLRSSQVARERRLSQKQKDFIMEYFEINFLEIDMPVDSTGKSMYAEDQYVRHMLLNVPTGKAQVEKSTQSRFNTANIDVTIRFVREMILSGFMPPQNIRILTFYNAQRRRYINATLDLANLLNLNDGELDDMVHTADSFQGCEEKCVVLDLVATHYGGPDSMGQ